jgi:hypothetical protein
MHTASGKNVRSVSTTWTWKKVKIEPAARPRSKQPPQAASGSRRAKRPCVDGASLDRRVHTIQVKYRGGPEAHWYIGWVGDSVYLPGHLSLHDALAMVLSVKVR